MDENIPPKFFFIDKANVRWMISKFDHGYGEGEYRLYRIYEKVGYISHKRKVNLISINDGPTELENFYIRHLEQNA